LNREKLIFLLLLAENSYKKSVFGLLSRFCLASNFVSFHFNDFSPASQHVSKNQQVDSLPPRSLADSFVAALKNGFKMFIESENGGRKKFTIHMLEREKREAN
jgi:hypothetical protein